MIEIMFTIFRGQEGIRDMPTCVKLEINSFIHRNTEKLKGRTEADIQASMVTNIGVVYP